MTAARTPSMSGVARGTTANLMGAVVMASANLVVTILVTHRLVKGDAGVFFACTSVFLVATTIGMLGTNTGLVYFVARCRALGRAPAMFSYFRVGFWPVVYIGCGLAVAMFVLAPQLAGIVVPAHSGEATTYLRILAVFIPFAGIENVTLAAARGLGSMRANVIVEQLGRSLFQILLVAVVLVAPTPWGLGSGWAFPYLPAAAIAYLWWRRQSGRVAGRRLALRPKPEDNPATPDAERSASVAREFWFFTAPRALASVGQLLIQRLDIVLVAAISGASQAAVYTVATRFLVVGQMGNRAISLAVQPRLAETLARDDRDATNHLYQASTAWLMLITWPLYVTFVVFGTTLLGIFGKGYAAGTVVVVILSCSMLVATLCGMVDMILNMGGRTSWNLGNVLVALATNIGLDLWLIPIYGVLGAAIGWAVAIVLQNLMALGQTGIILKLHPFGLASVIAGALNVVCFGAVGALSRWTLGSTWLAVVAAIAVGGALYLLGLWLLRRPLRLNAVRGMRRRRPATA